MPDGLPSRKNSVRNRPTPSAPTSLMPEYSWGNSTLTDRRMLRPSLVMVGGTAQRFQRLVGLFLFHLEAVVVFLRFFRGFQDEHALVAVQDGGEWLSTLRRAWSSPTTAGMPMERARMAVWETEEPISVAKP